MTIYEAHRIIREYYMITNPTEEDDFLYTEALSYVVEETQDPEYILELGGYYYDRRNFDLALKYYELAAAYGSDEAMLGLGYIWYYGRTGEKDYEKAFYYYDQASRRGSIVGAYKMADMYKNGYYVEKSFDRYKEIVEGLYPMIRNNKNPHAPLPEVFTRLGKIRADEGSTDEALRLYGSARTALEKRIRDNPFFGNLTIMKYLILDTYSLRPFDAEAFGLYDLYYILGEPAKVRFRFEDEDHEVEAVREDGEVVVRFDDKWFRTVDDFFKRAEVDGEKLTARYEELRDFELERRETGEAAE
ncbi:MAG: sel1 repeat family protein [Clostridia bacterium]|nr:sel1 repeat family protein [Clostridia bacterium]